MQFWKLLDLQLFINYPIFSSSNSNVSPRSFEVKVVGNFQFLALDLQTDKTSESLVYYNKHHFLPTFLTYI